MSAGAVEVRVPDIGDYHDVEVIEVLVAPGDVVAAESSLITLESDKATMEIPSPRAGRVERVLVRVGDRVSAGSPILLLAPADAEPAARSPEPPGVRAPAIAPPGVADAATSLGVPGPRAGADGDAELLVLGAGPGGYTAAFRAADLGLKVTLVERYQALGGVCLNVGCIPSKALLHAAKVIEEVREMAGNGLRFGPLELELERLRGWKDSVVGQLTGGLAALARKRGVEVVTGRGRFVDAHTVEVEHDGGRRRIAFAQAIIAAGSQSARLPGLPEDPRIMDSTSALALAAVPARLLIVGGGIIGLEMATVYQALGARVTVVELTEELLPGVDRDLVTPLARRLRERCEAIHLATRVRAVEPREDALVARLEGPDAPAEAGFDGVLVAVGRTANGHAIEAAAAGVHVTERGEIPVDAAQRTNVAHIFAVGDITGAPMLAHRASHQGKVAAEAAAGGRSAFDVRAIPAVAYTDPEIAWAGVTEAEARARGIEYEKGAFPWAASGRSLTLGRNEGLTKLLFARDGGRLIGGGIVGPNAGELIAEVTLAIEMGCDANDLGLTVHPHPTLSETVAFAAEAAAGTVTDLYIPRR